LNRKDALVILSLLWLAVTASFAISLKVAYAAYEEELEIGLDKLRSEYGYYVPGTTATWEEWVDPKPFISLYPAYFYGAMVIGLGWVLLVGLWVRLSRKLVKKVVKATAFLVLRMVLVLDRCKES
jgi:hypothetical protein